MIAIRFAAILVAAGCVVGFPAYAKADTIVDFEQYPEGTVLTDHYANLGGPGQGVVFGPLPGGAVADGLRPVVRVPAGGQPQSGSRVADIATCVGCEFFTPRTTGTFAAPRSRVSVHVGYLGDPAICTSVDPNAVGCAFVKLRAFDAGGNQVAESSVRVTRGAGVHALLSVSTPSATIVGFEISGRPSIDDSKPIAIDDLGFGAPGPTPPDFTLNPATANLVVEQGGSATVPITIGRLGGSSGDVGLAGAGLPAGVTATFSPNPAPGGHSTLTFAVDATATAANETVTITGTPQSPSVGPAPRSFTVNLAVQPACPQVQTAQELVGWLAAGFKCIFVKDTARIDLAEDLVVPEHLTDDGSILVIPDGVTLMGGRSSGRGGGILELSRRVSKSIMLNLGSHTRVAGLRLLGYNPRDRKDRDDSTAAILVNGRSDVLIDDNEIAGWPNAGVVVQGTAAAGGAMPRITRNFIHNNVQCNLGYGVVLGESASALVDRNVFNYNRHDVAGDGAPGQVYLARLNFSLTSGPKCNPGNTFQHYNQHYDMHGIGADDIYNNGNDGYGGTAGALIDIRDNTIRGAQGFYAVQRRPAFMLRGTPEKQASFVGNAVHHAKGMDQHTASAGGGSVQVSKGAVKVKGTSALRLLTKNKLVIKNNRTCLDTAAELAVGDFNGDGDDDVFQAVGTVWVYSPSGQREWFFLNASDVRLRRLGLGDFDGDGKTDVLIQDGRRWLLSGGGAGEPRRLPVGSNIDIERYRFGDFDGDRRTDVFRADGKNFFLSSAATTPWRPLAASRLGIGSLRLGDFDGDGKTDVFSLANNQWSVSFGGFTPWRRLNRKLSSNLGQLAFADFNGDGKTDVARDAGRTWQVSLGGVTAWQTLQTKRSEPLSVGMLFGDFTGDNRADVLQHGERKLQAPSPPCWEIRNGTTRFRSFERFRLSAGGTRPLRRWSSADMR